MTIPLPQWLAEAFPGLAALAFAAVAYLIGVRGQFGRRAQLREDARRREEPAE